MRLVGVDRSHHRIWGAVGLSPQSLLQLLLVSQWTRCGMTFPCLLAEFWFTLASPVPVLETKIIFQVTLFRFSSIRLISMKCHNSWNG